jgi:hypothetical protein
MLEGVRAKDETLQVVILRGHEWIFVQRLPLLYSCQE